MSPPAGAASHEVARPAEFCKPKARGVIRFSAARQARAVSDVPVRFLSFGRPPLPLQVAGSSSRGPYAPLQSPFAPACPPPPSRSRETPSLGFRPSWRRQPSEARTGFPTPVLPSSAFLTPATACASIDLAGLFHPATAYRVCSSGVSPSDESTRSRRGVSPRVVGAEALPHGCPQGAAPLRSRLQGLLPPEVRCLAVDG